MGPKNMMVTKIATDGDIAWKLAGRIFKVQPDIRPAKFEILIKFSSNFQKATTIYFFFLILTWQSLW